MLSRWVIPYTSPVRFPGIWKDGQLTRDVEGQVRQVWANLEKAVIAAGGTLKDIAKTTTYVVGAENLGKVLNARLALLPAEGRPTSTTLVVAGLADPDLLVEVETIAVLGD